MIATTYSLYRNIMASQSGAMVLFLVGIAALCTLGDLFRRLWSSFQRITPDSPMPSFMRPWFTREENERTKR